MVLKIRKKNAPGSVSQVPQYTPPLTLHFSSPLPLVVARAFPIISLSCRVLPTPSHHSLHLTVASSSPALPLLSVRVVVHTLQLVHPHLHNTKIGRASCRERVW